MPHNPSTLKLPDVSLAVESRLSRRSFGTMSLLSMLTGSMVFGNGEKPKDEDYLCFGTKEDFAPLVESWVVGGSLEEVVEAVDFVSLKKDGINLICTTKKWFVERWIEAHDQCVASPPRDKKGRIKVFRHYLYGESM